MRLVKAIDLLLKDHRTIKDLFSKFQKSNNDDEKMEIAAMVFRELKLHSSLEEEIFYPLIEGRLEVGDLVAEAIDEHQTMAALIEELETMNIDENDFTGKFIELTESVKHHIDEEETELIPLAEERLDREDIEQLNSEMAERRQTLAKEVIKESSDRRVRAKIRRRSPLAH